MTIQDDNRIIVLYQKFLSKTASASELEAFSAFLTTDGAQQRLFDLLERDGQENILYWSDINELRSIDIFEKIVQQPQERQNVKKLWPRIAGVAVILAVVFVSLFYNSGWFDDKWNRHDLTLAAQHITPGKNAATLTLADGRKIVLSQILDGALVSDSDVRITKTSDGEILYEIKGDNRSAPGGSNELSTAKGETYRVRLPDGSQVWLNAASRLKYPVSFAMMKSRIVELEGEAYFEIEKDEAHPFVVKSGGQEVTVLGTHFNIKSYGEEGNVLTTLVEGSVRVDYQAATWNDHGKVGYKDEVVLSPGQQSLLKGETIDISTANLEQALAWKEGNFIFNEEGIQHIMRDISRWYNIEVVYEGTIPKGSFSGNVSRSKNISQVLQALESTKLVHFKIEGRKVYVTK